jgi:hypothetical protein
LGGGPAAGLSFVIRFFIADVDTAGDGSTDEGSSAAGAVSHGSGPNEVELASASLVRGVRVNPGGEGEGGLMVGRVGLQGEGH